MRRLFPSLRLPVVAATLALASLTACGGGSSSSSASAGGGSGKGDLAIGVIGDTTGSGSSVTIPQLAGVQAWAKVQNAHGGLQGHHIRIDVCDAASSVTRALNCVPKMADDGIVISETLTGEVKAEDPALAKQGKVAFTLNPTIMPASGSSIFQASPAFGAGIKAIFSAAKARGISSVGVVTTDDASGQAIEGVVNGIGSALGITVRTEHVQASTVDATVPVSKLLQSHVGLVYAGIPGTGAVAVLSAMQTLHTDVPVAVNAADVNARFLAAAAGKRPDVVYGAPYSNLEVIPLLKGATRDAIQGFTKDYRKVAARPLDLKQTDLAGAVVASAAANALLALGDDPSADDVKSYLRSKTVPGLVALRWPANGPQVVNNLAVSIAAAKAASDSWGACPSSGALQC